jgi:ankyrin repeat protein
MNKLVTIAVSLLWSISAPLAAQDPEPLTPYEKALIESAFDGQLADVQVLVKKGASVKATDASKRTALMWAAFKGHTSVVEYLFGQGAEINAKDSDNMTALIYAAKGSALQTTKFLLKNGAEVNIRSKKRGITALMTAASWGNVKMVRLLLENGSRAELEDNDGITAERYAREGGHSEAAELLKNLPAPGEASS